MTFDRDRSVSRTIEIELLVRRDAPVFVDQDGRQFWLIPLSMMHRRTLVNFYITDELGNPLTMPGIRLTQGFDESILLAAANLDADDALLGSQELREFVRDFIAGEKNPVHDRATAFLNNPRDEPCGLRPLMGKTLFEETVRRLRRTFSLFVFLPVEEGRHRLLSMSFDEPTDWRYQRPDLQRHGAVVTYAAGDAAHRVSRFERAPLLAALALRPTRIRFQVPGAEHAASYHFEATAPQGIRIVEASLLAGRPNEPGREVSWDHVVGHSPKVGLHALEIPNGSLCRVQLDLAVPSRGWLATLLVASWLIFLVVLAACYHWLTHSDDWDTDRVTNVVAILITTSAGVAALLSQHEFVGVAARLVAPMRALAVVQMALPALGAGFLAYGSPLDDKFSVGDALTSITGVAFLISLLITFAWYHSLRIERRSIVRSPWDMTGVPPPEVRLDYWEGLRLLEFASPAIGIRSVESWQERYDWSDERQAAAVTGLREEFTVHDRNSCPTHWDARGHRDRKWLPQDSGPTGTYGDLRHGVERRWQSRRARRVDPNKPKEQTRRWWQRLRL
ncbi:MAG: hypothetical protein ABIW49_00255 [Knoellia sp.]